MKYFFFIKKYFNFCILIKKGLNVKNKSINFLDLYLENFIQKKKLKILLNNIQKQIKKKTMKIYHLYLGKGKNF